MPKNLLPMTKLIFLLSSLLLISGCKSEVDKCVDAQMDYFAQYQKKIESQSSLSTKTNPPSEQVKTFEDFGFKIDSRFLPQPLPDATHDVISPEKAKAMFRIDCLKAQAGK